MSADDLVFITREMFPGLTEETVKRMVQFNSEVKKEGLEWRRKGRRKREWIAIR